MIPISDINPSKNSPLISRIFIFTTIFIFMFIQPKNTTELFNFFYQYASIPCELLNLTPLSDSQFYANDCFAAKENIIFLNKNLMFSIVYSNFFHSNLLHIIGNLWSFWIFGNNIEDKLGKVKFVIFLAVIGIFSIGFHTFLNPSSIVPVVGASGIVSGLMGAYVYLFPNARLLVLVPFGILFPTTIKAKYFMFFWFISQIAIAFSTQNISWEAHLGGYLCGYLLLKFLRYKRYKF